MCRKSWEVGEIVYVQLVESIAKTIYQKQECRHYNKKAGPPRQLEQVAVVIRRNASSSNAENKLQR